jgi:hypothetical protein
MIACSLPSATDHSSSLQIDHDERLTASRRESLHDAALVGRFNAGDAGAFTEIVSRYQAKMFAIAFSHLKSHTDAEEIAQGTI